MLLQANSLEGHISECVDGQNEMQQTKLLKVVLVFYLDSTTTLSITSIYPGHSRYVRSIPSTRFRTSHDQSTSTQQLTRGGHSISRHGRDQLCKLADQPHPHTLTGRRIRKRTDDVIDQTFLVIYNANSHNFTSSLHCRRSFSTVINVISQKKTDKCRSSWRQTLTRFASVTVFISRRSDQRLTTTNAQRNKATSYSG